MTENLPSFIVIWNLGLSRLLPAIPVLTQTKDSSPGSFQVPEGFPFREQHSLPPYWSSGFPTFQRTIGLLRIRRTQSGFGLQDSALTADP